MNEGQFQRGAGETMKRLSTMFVMFLLLASTLPIISINASANPTTISTFSGGFATIDIDLQGSSFESSTTIDIPRNVTFTSASFNVDIDAVDTSPGNVWLDINEDGSNEWEFGGMGFGGLGHQEVFYDDTSYATISSSGGASVSPGILIPSEANLQSSTINATFSPSVGGGFFSIGEYQDVVESDIDGDQLSEPIFLSTTNSTAVGTGIAYADWTVSTSTNVSAWIGTCVNATSLSVGDLNGDGNQDVVTFAPTDNFACIHINNNSQATGFDPVLNISLPSGLIAGDIGDIDADGKEDIISIHGMGILSLTSWDNTTSNLTTPIKHQVDLNGTVGIAASLLSLAVDDFFGTGNISTLVMDQNGHWSTWELVAGSWAGPITFFDHIKQGEIIADLDNDGDLDLFGKNDEGYAFLINNGTLWNATTFSGLIEITNSTIIDYNGDGILDLLTPQPGVSDGSSATLEGNISYRSINTTALGSSSLINLEPWTMPQHIITMDMDGDGISEQIISAGEGTKGVFISSWHKIGLDVNGDGNLELEHSGYAGDGSNGLMPISLVDDSNAISSQFNPILLSLPRISNLYGVDVTKITVNITSNTVGTFNLSNLDIGYDASFRVDINPHATTNLTNVINQEMTAGVGTFSFSLPFNSSKAGNISVSNIVAVHEPGAPDISLPPTPTLTLMSLQSDMVTIGWDDLISFGQDLVRFEVFRLNAANGTPDFTNPYSTVMANITMDENIVSGSTYWYVVRSVHIFGVTSNLSNFLEVTIPYPVPPGVIYGVNVVDIDADTGGVLGVSWNASTEPVDHYDIFLETNNFSDIAGLTAATTVANVSTSTTISGLIDGTGYWVAVVAVDQYGNTTNEVNSVGPTYPRNDVPTPVIIELNVSESISMGQPFILTTSALLGGVSAIPSGNIIVTLVSSNGSYPIATDWNGISHSDFADLGLFTSDIYGDITIFANYSGDVGDEQIRPISSASVSVSRVVMVPATFGASAESYVLDWDNETSIRVDLTAQYSEHQAYLEGYSISWIAVNESANISVTGTETIADGFALFIVNFSGGAGTLWVNLTGPNWLVANSNSLEINLLPYGEVIDDNTTGNNTQNQQWSPTTLLDLVIDCPEFEVDASLSSQTTICTFTNPNNYTVSVELIHDDNKPWSEWDEIITFHAAIGQTEFDLAANQSVNVTIQIDVLNSSLSGLSGGKMTVKGIYEVEDSIDLNFVSEKLISHNVDWELLDINTTGNSNNNGNDDDPLPTNLKQKSSSTLLYIGVGFGIAVFGLIAFIVIRMRENIEWDDDEDEEELDYDEEIDSNRVSKPLPVGMALDQISDKRIVDVTPNRRASELMKEIDGEQEIEEHFVEYDEGSSEDSGISVDEDGTEWYEDEVGVWWFRDSDMEDWAEWTE